MSPDKTNENEETDEDPKPYVAGEEPDALKQALDDQAALAEGYLANWKRAQADLENFKKKAEQEKEQLSTFSNALLVEGLLPTLDDLERAFNSLDSSLAGLTWVDGLKLIYRKLVSTLEGQGLSVIVTEGATFDPKYHEAILHVPGDEGTVVGEMQKGYTFRDRVIRPALVKVGNGETEAVDEGSADGGPEGC
ncbi:MAG: nucleotide exchange factor GrpE [Chloroflexi bacterium]|nr:nucleotide exchange factor GrpE [Chloroflexota bacterium]